MYTGRSESSAGSSIYQAPLRAAGALSDPPAVGVYSSAAYAAVAAAAHGYVPFAVDSVAFYPSLQVIIMKSLYHRRQRRRGPDSQYLTYRGLSVCWTPPIIPIRSHVYDAPA